MEKIYSVYECPYCNQKGGKRLGLDNDGNEVCDKCGKYDNTYYEYIHLPEWSWNNFTANNKTLNKNKLKKQDGK